MKADTKKLLFSRDHGKAELIVFLAYIVGVIIIGIFHEPWFDESQAWSIARSAPFNDMIFKIPHYEGHPPLWYLMLAPFAKLGAPFEISLKAVNLAVCAAAVWVILYKSPFPKIVRCVIPFTFFFFYQTAVICRPYSLTMLGLALAAWGYKGRNEKPLRYILPLMLLCASHAYGIILAGGLCIVWAAEIITELVKGKCLMSAFKDKRFYSLLLILIFALALIALIIPAEDVRYLHMDDSFGSRARNLYMILIYPIDSLFGIYIDIDAIKQSTSGLITTLIGGTLLLALIVLIARKNKKLATFAVPFLMLSVFGVFKYLYWNHLGVFTFFLMFIAWIILDDENAAMPELFGKIAAKIESDLTRTLGKVALVGITLFPLSWTVYCCICDITEPYGMREVAQYIKDNNIEGHDIMMCWLFDYKDKSLMAKRSDANRINMSNEQSDGASLTPYFDSNIFYNFNITHHDDLYNTFKKTTAEDNERNFGLWREYGYPEYMFCKCPIDSVFPELEYDDIDEMYELEATFERHCFYKLSDVMETVQIYHLKEEYRGKGKPQ